MPRCTSTVKNASATHLIGCSTLLCTRMRTNLSISSKLNMENYWKTIEYSEKCVEIHVGRAFCDTVRMVECGNFGTATFFAY